MIYRVFSHIATVMTTTSFTLAPLLSLGLAPSASASGISVTLCSGAVIQMDLPRGDDDPLPQRPHSKACHAVCCQREPDVEDNLEPDPDNR